MSSVMSSRCREPLAMLETSREWMGLTCDINNLERMKSVGEIRRVKPHEDGGHLTNRRSAPEVTSPRLVRVQVSSSDTIQNWRNEDWNRNSWKPRTDFERSYFSVDKTSARSADGRWYHSSENCDGLAIERNGESRGLQGGSVAHTFSPSFHDSEDGSASVFPRDKPDILFQAGSNEFHGSRERIHEIFEHNRLLRRRFFADMPADDVPKQFPNDAKGSDQISLMKSPSSSSSVVKQTNSRFGSTETLTSQSNQSGASSNDPKFDHSPELFVFDCNKESLETVSFIDSKADPHELSVVRNANASPIESVSFEYRHLPCQAFARHSNYTDNRFDAAAEHAGDSGLSSIPRLDYEHCPSTEPKLFAAQVKILDLPEADGPSLRKLRNYRPASLDLSGVNKRSQIHEGIRRMMRNYTADVTPFLTDQQDSKNSYDVALRGTKSLLELSTPSSGAVGKKIHANKSCSDLTITQDLRSPQLVNSLTNSLMDLNVGHEGDGKLNGLSGSGTTLPLIYGPIPYKSPRRYVEGEVTIHYRSPVRTEAKEILSEEELARRSAENMRRVYQEERRRKYLQELHDIDSRRHTDNFIPSEKSPIPLNRYDDFLDDVSYRSRSQEQTPEPRLVARALYNFVGQTSRELSFRRGDIILIRRQIDKNWYEGEHNAMVGLFPLNYVEILPYDGARATPKKPYEGQARAKFNFIAQTNLELSLAKGELVVLTRRVDENWFEGRIGNKKGIFPVTYVEIIVEPGQHRSETPVSGKPVASPAAHSMLSNGTASGKLSMGPHHYTPSIPVKTSTTEPQYISLPRIGVTDRNKLHVAPVNETLHIDTHSDTLPYRALYNYRPQNEDELELNEGDTVYVIEKCDDGWFVGSSQRTGYFGTFPGNYVERL